MKPVITYCCKNIVAWTCCLIVAMIVFGFSQDFNSLKSLFLFLQENYVVIEIGLLGIYVACITVSTPWLVGFYVRVNRLLQRNGKNITIIKNLFASYRDGLKEFFFVFIIGFIFYLLSICGEDFEKYDHPSALIVLLWFLFILIQNIYDKLGSFIDLAQLLVEIRTKVQFKEKC